MELASSVESGEPLQGDPGRPGGPQAAAAEAGAGARAEAALTCTEAAVLLHRYTFNARKLGAGPDRGYLVIFLLLDLWERGALQFRYRIDDTMYAIDSFRADALKESVERVERVERRGRGGQGEQGEQGKRRELRGQRERRKARSDEECSGVSGTSGTPETPETRRNRQTDDSCESPGRPGRQSGSPSSEEPLLASASSLSSRQAVLAAQACALCAEALERNDPIDFHFGFCIVLQDTPAARRCLRGAPQFLSYFFGELCDLLRAKRFPAAANIYEIVLSALSSIFFSAVVRCVADGVMEELERRKLVTGESRLIIFTRYVLTPEGERLCKYLAVQGRRHFNTNFSSDPVEAETDFAEYDSPAARAHVFYISSLLSYLPHSVARGALSVKSEKISQCAARKKVLMGSIKGLLQSPPTRLQPEDQDVQDVILSTELLWSYDKGVTLASSQ